MQFSNLIIAAAALISSGSQAAVIPRQDPHIVDFRTYGLPGCYEQNQGVYTYTLSQTNICYEFVDETVESIFVNDISDGYSLLAYTGSACSENQITVPVGIANCYDQADGLQSYKIVPINGTSV
ncbi:hypothetical protein SLS53_002916 [Cytospora paraplurivora]|uniref:Uncharacterized protein n=1 Tax=Cytospora paraplurivora TaxID=2898453 RepID=A0AAN9UBW7_9PEZI